MGGLICICFWVNILFSLEVGQADVGLNPDLAAWQLCGEEVKIITFEHSFLQLYVRNDDSLYFFGVCTEKA